jgi:DNA replication protein DnaC
MQAQPLRYCLPHKKREIAAIEAPLRQLLRNLVSGQASWPLFLYGQAGSGKTCAALCLLDYCRGQYWTAADWCEALILAGKGHFVWPLDKKPRTPAGLWEGARKCSVLVLDEIGLRKEVSDFHYECVKRLLDIREGRPLVCISNSTLSQIGRLYDDRVSSRLAAGSVYAMASDDRRLPVSSSLTSEVP